MDLPWGVSLGRPQTQKRCKKPPYPLGSHLTSLCPVNPLPLPSFLLRPWLPSAPLHSELRRQHGTSLRAMNVRCHPALTAKHGHSSVSLHLWNTQPRASSCLLTVRGCSQEDNILESRPYKVNIISNTKVDLLLKYFLMCIVYTECIVLKLNKTSWTHQFL